MKNSGSLGKLFYAQITKPRSVEPTVGKLDAMGGASSVASLYKSKAYQVTTVFDGSPGAACGLQAKDDFILAMDDRDLLCIALNNIGAIVKVRWSTPVCFYTSIN